MNKTEQHDLTRTAVAILAAANRNDTEALNSLISTIPNELGGEFVATLAALCVTVHDALRSQLAENGVYINSVDEVCNQMIYNASRNTPPTDPKGTTSDD